LLGSLFIYFILFYSQFSVTPRHDPFSSHSFSSSKMAHKDPQNESGSQSGRQPQYPAQGSNFFRNNAAHTPIDKAPTASELLLGDYDPLKLHPLALAGDQLEYLQLEDDQLTDLPGGKTALGSRGWRDDMCYGTGTMYLSGALVPFQLKLCVLGLSISFPRESSYRSNTPDSPHLSYCSALSCAHPSRFKV
jgi:hypothetical protein